jgi:DNA-binding MarR family transcriptional regulator
MKISAEAATANQQLLHDMQTKWKEQEKQIEDRTYFKFLAYSSGVFEGMDLTERALLDIIAQIDERLTVSEAMSMGDIASGATIHRKLDNLRKAGWITYEYLGEDRRTKYLTPTEKAWSEYVKLNFAVREAANV